MKPRCWLICITITSCSTGSFSSTEILRASVASSTSPSVQKQTAPSTLATTSSSALPATIRGDRTNDDDEQVGYRHRCPEEWYENIWWNETRGGVIAARHCPTGYVGNAFRLCFYGSAWGEVDTSECRVAQIIRLKHLVYYHVHKNITDEFPQLARDLLDTLIGYRLRSLDDVLEALDMLTILLSGRLHLNLGLASHAQFIRVLLEICDRLFTHEERGWSPPINQQEVVTLKMVQVLHCMGLLSTMVADGIKRAGLSQFQVNSLPHAGLAAQITDANRDFVFNRVNSNKSSDETGDRIIVPGLLTSSPHQLSTSTIHHVIVTMWYCGFRHRLEDTDTLVNSALISSSVHPGSNYRATDPVTIALRTQQKWDSNNFRVECAYLRQTTNRSSLWSSVDCTVTRVEKRRIICRCHHANNVALILRRIHRPKSKPLPEPMNALVVFGCCVALLAFTVTLMAYAHLLRSDADESTLILFNLVISLATTQIVFMSGIQATANKEFCAGVSIVLHYLHLVASFWMLSHGIHLYLKVRRIPDDIPPRHMRDYCLLSWVVPVILVVITFIVNPRGYETRTYCWLSIERGMVLSFIVPVSALIMINTVLMVMVLKNFFELRAVTRKPDIDRTRIALRMGVVLLPLFGVNWFLGVLALEDTSTIFFEGAFAFTNSLQGFLVFFFNCIVNSEIRHSLLRKWCCRRKSRKSLDLRLRRSRRRGCKLDAQPLLVASNDTIGTPSAIDGGHATVT